VTRTANVFFSLLAFMAFAIVAVGFLAGVAAVASGSLRVHLARVLSAHWDRAIAVGFAIALVATAGSLYYSEIAGFVPCPLCWYQRIAMYPLVVILGIGWLRRDATAAWYALPLAGVGACISAYHVLVERYPSFGEGVSCSAQAPCTVPYFRQFGWVTLAVMALAGFLAVATLAVAALVGARTERTMSSP
jgi:disulfide bond formation protein DsbB